MDDDGRISERDAAEVAACYAEHAAFLYGFARVFTNGDPGQRAEDLVQETFEAAANAWGKLRKLDSDSQRAWLCVVLKNKVLTDLRRGRRLSEKLRLLVPLMQPDAGVATEELAALAEQAAEVIKNLPEQQYNVALLRWGADMKARQVADLLGIAEGTVHSHLNAVRTKLASALGPRYRSSRGLKGEAS